MLQPHTAVSTQLKGQWGTLQVGFPAKENVACKHSLRSHSDKWCAHSAWGEQTLGWIQFNVILLQLGPCSMPKSCVIFFPWLNVHK